MTPTAEITSPPHQHTAATTPALRGPERSSQPPQIAAEEPRKTKNSVNIQLRLETRQSHVVVNSSPNNVRSGQAFDFVMPIACDSGSQNTLKPYAMPMQRWMQSAAGGTSQRLKPDLAIILSRSRSPGAEPTSPPACSIVAMA